MAKSTLGIGNVDIELDGETLTLKPTLAAAQAISRQRGGIMAAIRAVGEFDLDMVAAVITLGLNLSGKDAKDIPERVYSNGMTELVAPVTKFLMNVANGGRPMDGDKSGDEGDGPNG